MTNRKVPRSQLKIHKGSVLAVPLDKGDWALGSVFEPGDVFYIGFSLERFPEPLSADDIQGKILKLFSWTTDGEIYRGNWKNLGVSAPFSNGKFPNYKTKINGVEMVESFDGKILRPFDPVKDVELTFRTSNSPTLVQNAILSVFDIVDRKKYYDDLLV